MEIWPVPYCEVLENRLRVVCVEMPHLHTVSAGLFCNAGPRHESAEDSGLSHFLEHMLFRGNARYQSSYELNLAFERLGSGLHGETGRDYSLFQFSCPASSTSAGLDLLGALLDQPSFRDMELERRLIIEESFEDFSESGEEINGPDLVRHLAYPDQAFSRRILGPRERVDAFDEQDLRRHFERCFGASNLVLAVAGPLPATEVVAAARSAFAFLPAGRELETAHARRGGESTAFEFVRDSSSQCQVQLLWSAPGEEEEGFAATQALSRIIDDGMATRLHYRICDQLGLAYDMAASLDSYRDLSTFEIEGQCSPDKVAPLLSAVNDLCSELMHTEIPADELERVKARVHFDLQSLRDDAGATMFLAGIQSLRRAPVGIEELHQRIDALEPGQVTAAARALFERGPAACVLVGALSDQELEAAKAALP